MCAPCDKAVLDGLSLVERAQLQEERRKQNGEEQSETEPEPEASFEGDLKAAGNNLPSKKWW
jgi:hypothetical protein